MRQQSLQGSTAKYGLCTTQSQAHNALQRYGHLKFLKTAAGCHLGFDPTGNGAVRSAVPENPTLERNTEWIARRVAVMAV